MKDLKSKLKHLREDFVKFKIDIKNLPDEPYPLFSEWIGAALEQDENANAFVLSTVSKSSVPSSRVVLLRAFDKEGFCFFTNYTSAKAQDIEHNNSVSMNFYWASFERQVRIQGNATKISAKESDAYFQSRPRESQLGAWVSDQSSIIGLYFKFAKTMEEIESKFTGKPVERPHYWGGYKINPTSIEFWQGRPFRLHQRIRYTKDNNHWKIDRLAP